MVAFCELQTELDDVLLEGDDALVELVDVRGCAEPGLLPRLLAERLGEALFELVDAAGETSDALLCVEQVGLQGRAGDRGPGAWRVRKLRLHGVDLFEKMTVAVEEAAIDAGASGDAADADVVPLVDGVVEGFKHSLAAPNRVGAASFDHGGGAGIAGGGHALCSGPSGGDGRMRGMRTMTAR